MGGIDMTMYEMYFDGGMYCREWDNDTAAMLGEIGLPSEGRVSIFRADGLLIGGMTDDGDIYRTRHYVQTRIHPEALNAALA